MNNKNIPTEIERFDLSARIQHVIMFTTFLLLSFTGWGLKYAYQDPASAWIRFWGGAKTAGLIHRAAGITMLLDFIYHQFYLLNLARKKDLRLTLVPMPKDVVDAFHNFMYFFGFRKEKPYFGKFNYMQKFDYWAVYWGMFIIGASGFFLAFPVTVSAIFPTWSTQWIWDVLFIMHSDEALLAIVFILIFHFYNEHLRSEVFPMNWMWLTGKMSIEQLKHHHPMEYDNLFGDKSEKKK
ncbi:MAG TPA: cytochrome b/b6 domain-containing protein [Nitrospirota bacterium]|nr:cytochrome b/b6 domain-containing protein [Nitrospirota bacterium]